MCLKNKKMSFTIQKAQPSDFLSVNQLITNTFTQFVAFEYSKEGQNTFLDYISLEKTVARQHNHSIYIAIDNSTHQIIGAIELREFRHVSLLFTHQNHLGKGIGKALFQKGKAICQTENPNLKTITVFSSPYAVDIYKKLGFETTDVETTKNGLRFTPMSFYH